MKKVLHHRVVGGVVRVLCLVVLAIILTAGLWPFHAPKNKVDWMVSGGLHFDKHGSILSAGSLGDGGALKGNSCTIELWLEPAQRDGQGTILGFYDPASRTIPFALRQFRSGMALSRVSRDGAASLSEIFVDGIFRGKGPVFVTIRSATAGTAVYADGNLLKIVPYFSFSGEDLAGQFVIGDTPKNSFGWSGAVKGLAVYNRELSDSEVSEEFANWTKGARPNSATKAGVVARYFFDEGKGSVVRNQVESATNLIIPNRFMVLHQLFLERPWEEFSTAWHYWKDVVVNVVGFIPLGFIFRVYFGPVLNLRRSTWLTITFGFAVSLTIEVLQSFLPTRDSGMTDLITNTFGTTLGASFCEWVLSHDRFSRLTATFVRRSEANWPNSDSPDKAAVTRNVAEMVQF